MVLSVVLLAALWAITDQTIRSTLRAAAADAVDVDLAGLVDIYASGGTPELQRRIADRLDVAPATGGRAHYLLADGAGNRLAGDIEAWPALDASASQSGQIALPGGLPAAARATRLGPDIALVVAHEPDDGAVLRRQVMLVFIAGGAIFVIVLGLFARTAAGRLKRRIDRINSLFRDPEQTPPDPPPVTAPDEIDELAAHSIAALERLGRLVEVHRETSNQIAHEIRTPLMHLDQRLVKALAANPAPEVGQRLVEARDEIRRLVQTLESLLDIAASHAGKGDASGLRPVELSDLLTRIAELYADSAEESGHGFTWQIAPGVAFAGEEASLGRMVTNLLDNAFKYVPPGGNIALTLEHGPVIVVRDDGPGIPAGERARVFERFYRVPGDDYAIAGSGLGLALAQAIANRHGLSIVVEDRPKGASFRIERAEK